MGFDGLANLKQKAAIRERRLMGNPLNCFPIFERGLLLDYGAFNKEGRFSQIENLMGPCIRYKMFMREWASIRSITVTLFTKEQGRICHLSYQKMSFPTSPPVIILSQFHTLVNLRQNFEVACI